MRGHNISGATLLESINGRKNNFTWIRLLLSTSIIYYHSFGLTDLGGYSDHLTAMLMPVTTVGGLAVQSFFFLSGLFVAQSYFRDTSFVHFTIKRALRIWPGLFICLFVTALLSVAASRPADFQRFLALEGLYSYVLKNSVFEFVWTIEGIFSHNKSAVMNGAIHTLPLEAKMYVVLGCVGLAGLIKTPARILLASLGLGVLCFVPGTLDRLPLHLFNADYSRTAICMFLGGMAAFGAAQRLVPRLWHGVLLAASLALTPGVLHVVCFYALVSWTLLYVGQNPWLTRWGSPHQDLSYGIYLYGWPSQQLVLTFWPSLNPYGLMMVSLVLASALAYFSWHVVEEPAIRLGKELSRFHLNDRQTVTTSASSVRLVVAMTFAVMLTWGMNRILLTHDFLTVSQMAASIRDFGPRESVAGQRINPQPNGDSAIWIRAVGEVPKDAIIVIDGIRLASGVQPGLVTGTVPMSVLSSAGDKKVFLEYRNIDRIERSNTVVMRILPK